MSNLTRITERDEEILQALALNVRLFSQSQIRQQWFDGDSANTRRRMKRLQGMGYVERVVVRSRSIPSLRNSLISWRPGTETPDFAKVAYACQSRWRQRHVQNCTAYIATELSANRYGGSQRGAINKELQVTHDLGVSQVWLHFRKHLPNWAEAWRGEDAMSFSRRHQKLPDGFLINQSGEVLCVVEFGGSYNEARIRDFHEDCVERALPYQLW